jgi:hypothetical protein
MTFDHVAYYDYNPLFLGLFGISLSELKEFLEAEDL